ncbi:MAG TPA: hypothetical protein VJL10_07435 [Anaerolineales bacterium]|nr:hypothetical protein [Anaerolineales bacterium]
MTEKTEAIDPLTLETLLDKEPPTDEENEADFKAGFEGVESVTFAEEEKVVEKEEKPAEKPDEKVGKPDDLSGLITGQLKTFKEDIDKQIRNINGKFGGLNSQLQSIMASAKTVATAQGGSSPTHAQVKEAVQSNTKFEALKEEFPEYAEALTEQIGNLKTEMSGKTSEVKSEDFKTVQTEIESFKDMLVETRHRKWKDTVQTSEFAEWFASQDDDTKNLAQSTNPLDAIDLLDKYADIVVEKSESESSDDGSGQKKSEVETKKIAEKRRLEAALTPTRKGGRSAPVTKSEHDDFVEGFNAA